MTNLKDSKPIKRKVLINTDNRIEPRPSDYYTMTIYPHGTIGFRANRGRSEITVSISSIYKMAMMAQLRESKPARKTRKVNRGLLSTFGIK
jgi:hypothetical protein